MKLELVVFWDHAKNTRTPLLCSVVGFNLKETDEFVCLTWWYTHNLDTKEELEDNQEPYVVMKSTIVKRFKMTIPRLFFTIISKWTGGSHDKRP